jgi:hypothetical protein
MRHRESSDLRFVFITMAFKAVMLFDSLAAPSTELTLGSMVPGA